METIFTSVVAIVVLATLVAIPLTQNLLARQVHARFYAVEAEWNI